MNKQLMWLMLMVVAIEVEGCNRHDCWLSGGSRVVDDGVEEPVDCEVPVGHCHCTTTLVYCPSEEGQYLDSEGAAKAMFKCQHPRCKSKLKHMEEERDRRVKEFRARREALNERNEKAWIRADERTEKEKEKTPDPYFSNDEIQTAYF